MGLVGVVCSSPTQCLAVGANSQGVGVAVPIDPATGTISSGQHVQTISGASNLLGVACSSSTQCLAVGLNLDTGGVAVPLNPTTGAISNGQSVRKISGTPFLTGVACPSSTQCLAVGDAGVVSLNPTTGAISSGQSVQSDGELFLSGVGCSSSTQCLAVGVATNQVGTFGAAVPLDPATGAIPSGQGVQDISGASDLYGVACSSSAQCLAVGVAGEESENVAVAAPLNPTTGAIFSGQSTKTITGSEYLFGVACSSSTQCLAGGTVNAESEGTTAPLNPATGAISNGQSVQTFSGTASLDGTACSTSTQCLGVGVNSNESGGVAVPLDPATGAESIAPGPYSPMTPTRIC
ncbi:MAG: hypothetical protein ACLPVF_09415, partial [Acidimicrobiales bacterium]